MKPRIGSLYILLSIGGSSSLHAQEDTGHAGHEHHHHHRNEIGIANAPVYFVEEGSFSYGLHMHFVRNVAHARWGYGVAYERIFDAHGHTTYGLVASYRLNKLDLILSPGATVEDEAPDEPAFAMHAEATYEFLFNNIHVGPVLEFAYDPEDVHISLGLHLGLGF